MAAGARLGAGLRCTTSRKNQIVWLAENDLAANPVDDHFRRKFVTTTHGAASWVILLNVLRAI